jgi:hypothetical protein
MQWWFWTLIATGAVALASVVYFLKKRKPSQVMRSARYVLSFQISGHYRNIERVTVIHASTFQGGVIFIAATGH